MDDAVDIARALGGRRSGKRYICRCPVSSHGRGRGYRNPSLSICDGDRGLMVNCFAGCDPRDVLGVLRERGLIGSKVTAFRKTHCPTWFRDPS